MTDRIEQIRALVLASTAVPSILTHARESAADIASLLAHVHATDEQAIAFAVDMSNAISGAASEIHHEIGGVVVTVDDDDDFIDFVLLFDGDEAAWITMGSDGDILLLDTDDGVLDGDSPFARAA